MAINTNVEVLISAKENVTAVARKVSDAFYSLRIASDEAATNFNKIYENTEKASSQFTKLGEKAQVVGANLAALGAVPLAGLIGATKAAIEFEDSFTGVRKTIDASEEEFAQLADNFREIARVTPLSVNELNRIGELAGQLGITGVDNLTKFTNTIAQVAVTTNLTAEAAATSFGTIINVMQESVDNVDNMGAAIVDLGNKFNANEAQIVAFSERIAGAGKIAGLSTDEVFAIGTAMASVGVEAEAGGTAVQKVLINMMEAASGATVKVTDNSKAIAQNKEQLEKMKQGLAVATQQQKEFGDKTKESSKMMMDNKIRNYTSEIKELEGKISTLNASHGKATVTANSFAKVLGMTDAQYKKLFKEDPSKAFTLFVNKLRDSGDQAVKILDDLELKDERLVRAFLSLANAGDLLNQTFDVSANAWEENSALTEEAQKRFATASSQLQILKNNLYDAGITIGSAVLPAMNSLIQAVVPLIQKFAQFADEHPKLVAGLLAAGAGIAALGAGLVILGTVVTSAIQLWSALTAGIGLAKIALTGLWGLMVAHPIGALLIALGLLTAGVIWLSQNTDILKTKQDLVNEAQQRVEQSTKDLETAVINLETAQKGLTDADINLEGASLRVERATKTLADATRKYGKDALVTREAAHQLTVAEEGLKEAKDRVKEATDKAVEATNAHTKAAEENQKQQEELQKTIESQETWWGNLKKWVNDAASALSDFLRNYTTLGVMTKDMGATRHQTGGVIPGPIGAPTPAILHGGERVTPAGLTPVGSGSVGGGGGTTFNVYIGMYAGTEVEKRNMAKQMYSALLQLAQSENKSVAEYMGG